MTNEEKTFDESLLELEKIVAKLEQGDVPLEEALAKQGLEIPVEKLEMGDVTSNINSINIYFCIVV